MEKTEYDFDMKFDERSSGSDSSSSRGLTIWAKVRFDEMDEIELDRSLGGIENYPFCRIRTFDDRLLAEKYLDYLDRYFELHPEFGISELYLKKDGDPVYQIYFVTSVGDIIVVADDEDNNEEGLWFDYEEMLNQLKALKAGNPECEFHFREVEIDDDQSEILEIPGV